MLVATTAIAVVLLAACGPDVVGITKGVDVIELRAWAGPTLIHDTDAQSKISAALLELVGGVTAVETLPDASIRSGARPYVRISFLGDERAGNRKVHNALLFYGPDPEARDAARFLLFRARGETDWNRAGIEREALRKAVAAIGTAAGIDLLALGDLAPAALDAARRAINKVSSDRGLFGEEIAVASVEDREWPSSALGFPRDGMAYATVIVPGHRVELRLPDGAVIVCHTSADRVVADYE
jgi:hypothetical protein